MNIERLRATADAIEEAGDADVSKIPMITDRRMKLDSNEKTGLDSFYMPTTMTRARNDCGTVGCIAGFGVSLFHDNDVRSIPNTTMLIPIARNIFGLSRDQGMALFDPMQYTRIAWFYSTDENGMNYYEIIRNTKIKARHAVAVLRAMKGTETPLQIISLWRKELNSQ